VTLDISIAAGLYIPSTLQVIYTILLSRDNSLLISKSFSLFILLTLSSQLVLYDTSLDGVLETGVSMEEYTTYYLIITLSEGTTLSSSVVITVSISLLQIASLTLIDTTFNIITNDFSYQIASGLLRTNISVIVNFMSLELLLKAPHNSTATP
jgi:hypothetical protein